MSRQGVRVVGADVSPEAADLLRRFHPGSCLRLEAVMTHFCAPETMSSHRPNPQLASLAAALEFILRQGLRPQWLHAGNSSSIVAGPDRQALIEMASSAGDAADVAPRPCALWLPRPSHPGRALMGWRRPRLGAGAGLEDPGDLVAHPAPRRDAGYGHTFTADGETRIALLPAGYADGLNRLLSNRGHVLIRGQEAPIAGRVSMDQTMVDVTGIPGVAIGDEVVLLGSQGAAVNLRLGSRRPDRHHTVGGAVRDQRAGSTGGCGVDRRHRSIQISWILKKTSRFVVSHISRKTSEMPGFPARGEGHVCGFH
jgi:alanine racemase